MKKKKKAIFEIPVSKVVLKDILIHHHSLVDVVGAQVVFSFIPSVTGMDIEPTWKAQLINTWLRGWCHCRNFVFF